MSGECAVADQIVSTAGRLAQDGRTCYTSPQVFGCPKMRAIVGLSAPAASIGVAASCGWVPGLVQRGFRRVRRHEPVPTGGRADRRRASTAEVLLMLRSETSTTHAAGASVSPLTRS